MIIIRNSHSLCIRINKFAFKLGVRIENMYLGYIQHKWEILDNDNEVSEYCICDGHIFSAILPLTTW